MADALRVEGLRELRKELKALEGKWGPELRKANLAIAEMVAEGTRSDLSGMGGSAGKVVPTVKALAGQARAQVKVGGGNSIGAQVAMGNVFGATRYKQFPAHIKGGYALFPTIKRMRDDIVDRYADLLDELLAKAFPD